MSDFILPTPGLIMCYPGAASEFVTQRCNNVYTSSIHPWALCIQHCPEVSLSLTKHNVVCLFCETFAIFSNTARKISLLTRFTISNSFIKILALSCKFSQTLLINKRWFKRRLHLFVPSNPCLIIKK